MTEPTPLVILCNGADPPSKLRDTDREKLLRLEYRNSTEFEQNVTILLPDFVRDVFHLPNRVLDLLEIAAYVFLADRLMSRGRKDDLEYHKWARSLHFVIRVRDHEFWEASSVHHKLVEALRFMTGDRAYEFSFLPGHTTPRTGLFDSEGFVIEPKVNTSVTLFSGGLDSLAGIIERLEGSSDQVCLISHRSGQPGTRKTQDRLFAALRNRYPNRLVHYRFHCSLKDIRANDETQRTRAFLYASIAYAICCVLSQDRFFVYENGVAAINFLRRQDLQNARASRTAHPRTLALLEEFFSEIHGSRIKIATPFLWKTKADVFGVLSGFGREDLITSTVSCSKTFQNLGQATHCGGCFQCIDRKLAAYAAGLDDIDDGSGIYALNFIKKKIDDGETKTILVDYVRQARNFAEWNIDCFYKEKLSELAELTDYISGMDEEEVVNSIFDLCHRHGEQVLKAIKKMREVHDHPFRELPEGSFLQLINEREHLKEPVQRLIVDISRRLQTAIPLAFKTNLPKDERDLNDKISAIVESSRHKFEREHPAVRFALAQVIPDHSLNEYNLLIESKYVRESTSPSKASEGIAADLTKYPEDSHILFIVYDPYGSIVPVEDFKGDFEKKGRCTVCVIR
ncbi:MAG: 7-cyano-7-deazaguanine synthase [Chloroflexi bacterium]|nr:7-cyano-7-deazaguanine synthase [Chloroflexota bacterium]MDA8187553.1 7-cyano-7-deazaguanine synthase [Dehalococcoidales bacterium]